MKTIMFTLLFLSAAAFGQTVPPPASAPKPVIARETMVVQQAPSPMRTMQVPIIPSSPNSEMTALIQKQTAAILELSNRIKALDARIAKLEEKGK